MHSGGLSKFEIRRPGFGILGTLNANDKGVCFAILCTTWHHHMHKMASANVADGRNFIMLGT